MIYPLESSSMRWFRKIGMDAVAWSLRRLHCPVGPDNLVLEVGSGGNPYARADVLLDAYEDTRERHWAPLVADRPTVLGLVERLPFIDGAFDFVIASHVLEHSAAPERFLSELQRVARAGYIETPDAFMERINPYRDHRLEILLRDGQLVIRKKPHWVAAPDIVALYEHWAKPLVTTKLIPRYPFAFHVRHFWQGHIDYRIVNPEVDAGWPAPESAYGSRTVEKGSAARIKTWGLAATRRLLPARRCRRPFDLLPLLKCSRCDAPGSLDAEETEQMLRCCRCEARFPVRGGIPDMTKA